jgi:hypothetical protein
MCAEHRKKPTGPGLPENQDGPVRDDEPVVPQVSLDRLDRPERPAKDLSEHPGEDSGKPCPERPGSGNSRAVSGVSGISGGSGRTSDDLGILGFIGKLLFPVMLINMMVLVSLTPQKLEEMVKTWGFHAVFVVFFLGLTALPWGRVRDQALAGSFRHWPAVAAAIGLTVAIFLVSPPRFRIFADEINLLGTAGSMYDHHSCFNPTQLLSLFDGTQDLIDSEWDIRPTGFPFLIYLTHALTGYRPENAFLVNGFLGSGALFLFYLILRGFFSTRTAFGGMGLLAAVPVVVLSMTSGGMETATLFFVLLSFYGFSRFLFVPTAGNFEFTGYSLLLLAQIRYESLLFTVILVPFLVFLLPEEERSRLTWRTFILPILFIPTIWHRLVFSGSTRFQTPDGQVMFGWSNFRDHLKPAFTYLMGGERFYGSIPVFSLVLPLSLPLFLSELVRGKSGARELRLFTATGVLALSAYAIIVLAYHAGDLTQPWTNRLGGLFFPFLLFPTLGAIDRVKGRHPWVLRVLLPFALAMMCWYWPEAGSNRAVRGSLTFRAFPFVRGFLHQTYPDTNVLLVSQHCNLFIPFRYSGVSFVHFREKHPFLTADLRRRLFRDILVVQEIQYRDGRPTSATALTEEGFILVPVAETQWSDELLLRISRVLPVRPGQAPRSPPTIPR